MVVDCASVLAVAVCGELIGIAAPCDKAGNGFATGANASGGGEERIRTIRGEGGAALGPVFAHRSDSVIHA